MSDLKPSTRFCVGDLVRVKHGVADVSEGRTKPARSSTISRSFVMAARSSILHGLGQ